MSALWAVLVAALLVVALSYASRSARQRAVGVACALGALAVGGLGLVYLTRPSVRVLADTWLHPVAEHRVLEEGAPSLPLPPQTALRYRYSAAGAAYFSRLGRDDVVGFYRQAVRIVAMGVDGQATHLTVEHEGKTYLVTVTPARSGGVDLQVDLRE